VNCLTGLPEAEIRLLYWMLHGARPPGGPLPSTGTLLASRGAQARVSAFVSLYRRIGGPGAFAHVDPVLLIRSFDLFQELAPAEAERARVFDFTAAWVLTRDLRSGVAELKFCKVCRLIYLTSQESTLPPNCPFCSFRKAEKKRPSGTSL
jgi:hypothetical protein